MIPRYKIKEISNIWSTKNKLDTWLKVELAHLSSLTGNIINRTITEEELQIIKDNVEIDIDRWKEIEKETKHDLQAFVQMLEESVPGDAGRWIHYGLTSSDILDTSLTIMCRESIKVIKFYLSDLLYNMYALLKKDYINKNILSRTHGKSAEIQTYYEVFTRWIAQLQRGYDELTRLKSSIVFGKLSGPSGNYTTNDKQNEYDALSYLDLKPVKSSQIISRDIYLDYFYGILKVMLAVEKIAYDIRIYSIDGINEMSEPFSKGQKGSSAMPHKKNPIATENICGMSRLFKSYFNTAMENCLTLLERDISHSCTERIIFKDAAHIACYTLSKLTSVIENLNCFPENSEYNCEKYSKQINAQYKMNEMIKSGSTRKESHDKEQIESESV